MPCSGLIVRVLAFPGLCYDKINIKEIKEMKRTILVVLMAAILVLALAIPALAGGDKVRGENGQGDVNQVQVQDPPPFQP
jgi:hypothetical protein